MKKRIHELIDQMVTVSK